MHGLLIASAEYYSKNSAKVLTDINSSIFYQYFFVLGMIDKYQTKILNIR